MLRFFPIAGMVVALVLAWFAGVMLRDQMASNVQGLATRTSVTTARYFESEVWNKYRDILTQGYVSPEFKQDMNRFALRLRATGVRIYNANGLLLYTSGGTINLQQFNEYAQAARMGRDRTFSELTTSGKQISSPLGTRELLHSFITLGQGEPEGYMELYLDVTDELYLMSLLQWMVVGGMIGIVAIGILALTIINRRAENLLAVQHERLDILEAKASHAEEETRQKTQFLANISHELRTPLNAIIGFSELLKTAADPALQNTQVKGYINDINSSGVHLLALINDILDFSKAEAGKLELEIEEINATKLAASSLRLVEQRAQDANVKLVNNLPKEPFVLETDGKKFKQILLNLLSNAVKFTPSGGTVKLTGWLDLASDSYVFQVADSGIGINQKDIAKALSAFGQVDNTLSKKYEGTGLGLPLTRKFVELMGGRFAMQSEPNVGTTVTFSLPRTFREIEGVVAKRLS